MNSAPAPRDPESSTVDNKQSGRYYVVKNILNKRIDINGKIEYLIKIDREGDEVTIWEPKDRFTSCPVMVEEFESMLQADEKEEKNESVKEDESKQPRVTVGGSGSDRKRLMSSLTATSSALSDTGPSIKKREKTTHASEVKVKTEFSSYDNVPRLSKWYACTCPIRQVEKVIGATVTNNGQLMLLLKWKGEDVANFVPSIEANVLCPQLVIEFYQKRLNFGEIGDDVNQLNFG